MRLIVSKENIGWWAAQYIKKLALAAALDDKKPFVLGLPTGQTVVEMYGFLCQFYKRGELDFSRWVTFNMDEYVGLPPQHPQSYHFYMHRYLLGTVNIPPAQTHVLNGLAPDLQHECDAYEQAIRQAGGIRLFLGGVGRNGHLAFNEPGSSFASRTRPVTLTPSTLQANSRFFNNDISQVPTQALSVGIGTVLEARELLFLASGAQKAQAVARLSGGEITPDWPITALKTHPNATLLTDEAAAAELSGPVKQALVEQQRQHPQGPTWSVEI